MLSEHKLARGYTQGMAEAARLWVGGDISARKYGDCCIATSLIQRLFEQLNVFVRVEECGRVTHVPHVDYFHRAPK
jgi:hypothetical protein